MQLSLPNASPRGHTMTFVGLGSLLCLIFRQLVSGRHTPAVLPKAQSGGQLPAHERAARFSPLHDLRPSGPPSGSRMAIRTASRRSPPLSPTRLRLGGMRWLVSRVPAGKPKQAAWDSLVDGDIRRQPRHAGLDHTLPCLARIPCPATRRALTAIDQMHQERHRMAPLLTTRTRLGRSTDLTSLPGI